MGWDSKNLFGHGTYMCFLCWFESLGRGTIVRYTCTVKHLSIVMEGRLLYGKGSCNNFGSMDATSVDPVHINVVIVVIS